jgi:hypothetical protein
MKSKILYIAFLFLHYSSFGQIKIENLSLTKPDSNILYIGVDNKIQLLGPVDSKMVVIVFSGKTIISNNGIFEIKVSAPGKSRLEVFKNNKRIASREYIISRIPEPQCGLGYFHDTILQISQVLAIKKVNAFLPNCILNLQMPVISFDLEVIYNNGNRKSLGTVYGNSLPSYEIFNLQVGDKLNFNNIRVGGPDDNFVSDFYIVIK